MLIYYLCKLRFRHPSKSLYLHYSPPFLQRESRLTLGFDDDHVLGSNLIDNFLVLTSKEQKNKVNNYNL